MQPARGLFVRAGLLGGLFLGACSPPVPPTGLPDPGRPVAVEQTRTAGETHYGIALGTCRIRWELRAVEPGVILQRSACTLPLVEQAPLLLALWDALPARGELRWFWGRICPDAACAERQISQRLALAAHRAPDWDARRGRPRSGHENRWVLGAVDAAALLPELRGRFQGKGVAISIAGVEKVLVAKAGALPYYAELQRAGVAAEEKLPYDALLWLRLSGS